MEEKQIIRVKPKSFESGWEKDFMNLGIKIPKPIPEDVYAPVNHNPMPFTLEVDLKKMKIVRRIVGVMPNALYRGHIFDWNEFCKLIDMRR